jgi:hypothetical protein
LFMVILSRTFLGLGNGNVGIIRTMVGHRGIVMSIFAYLKLTVKYRWQRWFRSGNYSRVLSV